MILRYLSKPFPHSLLQILLILAVLCHPTDALVRGPTPQLPPLSPNAAPPIPAHKTAYVTVHTHTSTSYAYYQPDGILTMYSTLLDTNTTRARIVLVTHNTPHRIRQLYTDAGLDVREIPATTADGSAVWSDQCSYKFNKIHVWDSKILPEYETCDLFRA